MYKWKSVLHLLCCQDNFQYSVLPLWYLLVIITLKQHKSTVSYKFRCYLQEKAQILNSNFGKVKSPPVCPRAQKTHENKTELWHCSELNTTSDHIKNMSHSAGAKLRSNVIIHNTSRLLIFHHACERPSDNLSPPGSHTAQGPMTLTPGWFLQHCWWADVFRKH